MALIVSILPSTSLWGQNYTRIDSLKQAWRSAGGPERFNIMNQIGFEYRMSNPDSTIWFCTQALEFGKELKLEKGLAESLGFLGLASTYKSDPKGAYDYFTQAIAVAQEQSDSLQLAHNTNNLGRLYFDQGDASRAYKMFREAQSIFEALDDKSGMAYVHKSLSAIYKSQGEYTLALETSRKAYYLRQNLKDTRGMLSSLSDLAMIHYEIDESEKAVECLGKADRLAVQTGDRISRAELKLNVSEILLAEKRLEEADREIREAEENIAITDNLSFLPRVRLLRAKQLVEVNKLSQAEPLLVKIASDSENSLQIQREANRLLSVIYDRIGNPSLSTTFRNTYLIQNEKLQNDDLTREIERLKFQLAIEKKEKEYELLRIQQAQDQKTIHQQRLANSGLIAIAALFLILAAVMWSNARKRRRLYDQLAHQKDQIEKQRAEIMLQNQNLSSQNEELTRISAEKDTLMSIVAHDLKSPLARIAGIANLLNMEGGLGKNQQQYLAMLQEVSKSGEEMIADLLDLNSFSGQDGNPSQHMELRTLLEERLDVFRREADRKQITMALTMCDGGKVECDTQALTRVVDNLISNALKFSPYRSHVAIEGSINDGFARISVKDQGPGFTEEDKTQLFQKFRKLSARPTGRESSNGLGLAIVKLLSDRLGATLQLNSRQGKGTVFTVLCPVRQQEPQPVKP